VYSAEDGLKVQVTPCGPAGGTHPRDDLAHLHSIPRPDGDGLQVVVGGNQPVAMVNLHAVSTAPGMPSRSPDDAGVGRIDPGAAARGEILTQMEVPKLPRDGTDAEPEGRAIREYFKGRHQGAFRRALELGRGHIQRSLAVLGDRPDDGAAEGDERTAVRQDRGSQGLCTHVAGGGTRHGAAGVERRDRGQSESDRSRHDGGAGGQGTQCSRTGTWRLFFPAGTPMISH
jgi:hypothetical protein